MIKRRADLNRKTKETQIEAKVILEGRGNSRVDTGIPFLDHMLETLAKHGLFDIDLKARGDLHIDNHHTNEDVGIVLGQAFKLSLGDKKSIRRFGDFRAPLDEALAEVRVSMDISGRGACFFHARPETKWISHPALRAKPNSKGYTLADAKHFLESFAFNAGITLHVDFISGEQPHHVIEAMFKALAKALSMAVSVDPRVKHIPSTKGKL